MVENVAYCDVYGLGCVVGLLVGAGVGDGGWMDRSIEWTDVFSIHTNVIPQRLTGQVGMLATNRPREEVIKYVV